MKLVAGADAHLTPQALSRRLLLKRGAQGLLLAASGMTGMAQASDLDTYARALVSDNASAMVDLIFKGFNPNTLDPKGRPGLVAALQQDSPRVYAVLLKSPGIDVNVASAQGETPLMMACIKGELKTAKVLIERGADINREGWTPLHYAVSTDKPETLKIIQLLLEGSAYIDASSPNGSTPLMLAAQYSSEDVVDFLIKEGADVVVRNHLGLTAVDFAKKAERPYMVERLNKAVQTERRTQPARGAW